MVEPDARLVLIVRLIAGIAGRSWVIGLVTAASFASAFNACSSSDSTDLSFSDGGGGDASTTNTDGSPTTDGNVNVPDGSTGPSGPLDPSAAAKAAIFIASCISDDGLNRTLQELYLEKTTSWFRSPKVLACLASKANGCAAITDCIGLAYSNDGPCDAGCAGNVHQECSPPKFRLSVDCTKAGLGLECKPAIGAYCGAPGDQSCDVSTFVGSCDNGTPVGCVDGLTTRGLHCPDYGASCELLTSYQNGGKVFGCKGSGGACSGTNNDDTATARWEGVRCENGKLLGCMSNGLAPLDCASVGTGFTCFDAPDGGTGSTAYCGTAAECSPRSSWNGLTATCTGTSVTYCNGGKIETVDCLSLGFTGCSAKGVCTPPLL